MTHMLLVHGGVLKSKVMNRTQQLATYWSATVHDYEHGGLNNDFLIKTAHPLAITYNDSSPLENHHLAASSRVLYMPEYCFPPVSLLSSCIAVLKACRHPVCGCIVHLVDTPEYCFPPVSLLSCCSAVSTPCMYSVCGCIVHLVDSQEDCFPSVTRLYCGCAVVKACSCDVCGCTLQLVLQTFMPIMQHMYRQIPWGCHHRILHSLTASLKKAYSGMSESAATP